MFNIGDEVCYHSFIGGPVSSTGHKIKAIELMPNNFGCDVAWISDKSGCVALAALSNDENPMEMKPVVKKLTRSQQKYKDYQDLELSCSFREYMGFSKSKKSKAKKKVNSAGK